MKLIYLMEGFRMMLRRLKIFLVDLKHYDGSPEEICMSIVRDCYDAKMGYFRISNGNFCEFYCRDFGWCAESLVMLGFRAEVVKTLNYALDIFEKHGSIEQTISPHGKPFTFPNVYSPDSIVFVVHALRCADDQKLVNRYKHFIEQEVNKYYRIVIEQESGIVKKNVHFSSMKDYSIRSSSCYDTSLAGMLSDDLNHLGIFNPLNKYDYQKILIKYFWNGRYFTDDLSGNDYICGDANVLPFWTGMIKNKTILKKALVSMRNELLDVPFPLKYTGKRHKGQDMIKYEAMAGDYERDAIWAHMGFMYIRIVADIDKRLARKYLSQYGSLISKYKNFLEVYDRDGKPFKTLFYYSDDAMLWAANYLTLYKILR